MHLSWFPPKKKLWPFDTHDAHMPIFVPNPASLGSKMLAYKLLGSSFQKMDKANHFGWRKTCPKSSQLMQALWRTMEWKNANQCQVSNFIVWETETQRVKLSLSLAFPWLWQNTWVGPLRREDLLGSVSQDLAHNCLASTLWACRDSDPHGGSKGNIQEGKRNRRNCQGPISPQALPQGFNLCPLVPTC